MTDPSFFNGKGGFETRPYVRLFITVIFFIYFIGSVTASEVLEETSTHVMVRKHPRTGKPFVSVIKKDSAFDPFQKITGNFKRPDYRMLDPKIKSGQIPYEGPSSDRKKVTIFAASLAAVGTLSGAAVIATAPAATGAGAAGGAGAYGAAGGAVAVGTISGAVSVQHSGPDKENFDHVSKSEEIEKSRGDRPVAPTDNTYRS